MAASRWMGRGDKLGADVAGVTGMLDIVGRVQVVQRMDDVHGDVRARAATGFPDRGTRGADEQLRGAGRLAETVRRADDGIVSVHDGVPRELLGEAQLLDEICERLQLAAPQTARTLPCHDRSSSPDAVARNLRLNTLDGTLRPTRGTSGRPVHRDGRRIT